jgi:hypothetical protein
LQQSVDIIGIYDNQDFAAPIVYTLDLILSLYGVSYRVMLFDQFKSGKFGSDETLVVSYGSKYLDTGAKRQTTSMPQTFSAKTI